MIRYNSRLELRTFLVDIVIVKGMIVKNEGSRRLKDDV